MKFTCNFCTELFSDFLTYKGHLRKQHNVEKRIIVKEILLEKRCISCVESCNWLERQKSHALYNVDGNQYCEDCKRACVARLRITKAFESYLDQIEDLDEILYPDLWVKVEKNWFECCWCVDTRHGDEEGGTFYEFAKYPKHILCDRCFDHLKEKDSFSRCQPSSYCSECNLNNEQ